MRSPGRPSTPCVRKRREVSRPQTPRWMAPSQSATAGGRRHSAGRKTPKVQPPASLLAQVAKDQGRMSRKGLSRRWEDHEGEQNNQESIGPRSPHGASGAAPWHTQSLGGAAARHSTTGKPARHAAVKNVEKGMPGDEPTQVYRGDEGSEGYGKPTSVSHLQQGDTAVSGISP